jgi:ATP-binding cassette, subfamily C, bacterial CydCD
VTSLFARIRRFPRRGSGGFGQTAIHVPPRTLVALGVAAVGRAVALLLIADGLAGLIVLGDAGGATIAAAGVVLRAVAGWATGVTGRRAAAAAKLGHRRDLARGVVERDLDAGSVAALAARGLDDLDGWFTGVVPAAIAAVVVPLGLGARILSLDLLSAIVIAVTLPLVPLFMVLIGMHSRDSVRSAQDALARLADHVAELARGLPVLVGLGRDAEQTRRLAAIQDEHTRRTGTVLKTAFLSALALELLATISVAVVAVFLGLRLLTGDVTLFDALVVLLLAPECFTALRELGVAHHAAEDGRAALDRVRALLPTRRRPVVHAPGPGVRVRGLEVSYAGRRTPIRGADLHVVLGELVALAGPSGAGKSTVLAAIAGVLPEDVRVVGTIAGGDRVAWAPQDPRTVGDTVRDELALYGGGDELLAELDLAHLADRACGLLSPGERRRLAVARALAGVDGGARVLLLDEPTAHLDVAAAELVRAAIARRRPYAATVLVSHDAATRALADRTVLLGAAPSAHREPIPFPVPEEPSPPPAAVAPVRVPGRDRAARTVRLVLAPAAGWWMLSALLAVVATGMGLALTAVSGWLIVRAAEQPAIMYLLVAIVGVRFFGIGRAVARYGERLATHRAAFRATDAVRLLLWRAIAARSAGSRDLLEGGRAVDHLVGTVGTVRDALPRLLPPFAAAVATVGGVVLTVQLVAPAATGVVAAGLLVALVVPGLVAFLAGRAAEARRITGGGQLLRDVAVLGAAARELRANGVADRAVAGVDQVAAQVARAERRAAPVAEAAPVVGAALAGLTAAATGLVLAAAGGIPISTVAVVVLLVFAAGDPLAGGASAVQRMPALRTALARVQRLLARPEAPAGGDRAVPSLVALRLDDLAVTWPGASAAAVTGVNGDVGRGEWLALTGPSGAGKSTILTALLGGIAPSGGRVLANGVDLATLDVAGWRRRVAWCPQDAHVFDSTLRGNLALARRDGDEQRMRDALHRVGLAPLLRELSAGLDGRVGPGGRALSGGERQRLAVARALLADAEVVLLDEPTAHLDAPTAEALLADLRVALADRIVVIVTHRPADLRPEDHVVELPLAG